MKTNLVKHTSLTLLLLISLFVEGGAQAQSVSLAWNRSSSANVSGYEISYGKASENYTSSVKVGNVTNYTITGLSSGVTYYFAVAAYESSGNSTKTSAYSNEVHTNSGATAVAGPVIETEPASVAVASGSSATFTVVAASGKAMTYQWYFNGVPLFGSASATLTLASVTSANAGSYTVLVSSSPYSVLSSAAVLSISAASTAKPPIITTQPSSETIVAGASAAFSVAATSTLAMTYQWYFNGAAISAATTSALTLSTVSSANAGNYTVVVKNSAGSVTSSAAVLSVSAGSSVPVIVTQPLSQSVASGKSATFSVGATSGKTVTYQWYFNNSPILGATSSSFALSSVTASSAGNYTVLVSSAPNSVMSAVAVLTVSNASLSLAGTYNGLFYQTSGSQTDVAEATAGMLANCVVGSAGTYSAKVYIAGTNYSIAGTFNASGRAASTISRSGGLSSLYLSMNLDSSAKPPVITGSVSNMSASNPWVAPLVADLATNALPIKAGTFSILVPAILNPLGVLTGDGTITVTTSGNGTVTLSGTLDDYAPVSQTVPVSNEGTIPFYCSLYGGTGLIEGWINLANESPNGTITWIRPAGITTGMLFPLGFTHVLSVN